MAELKKEGVFGVPFVASDLDEASAHFAQLACNAAEPYLVAHADVHVLTRILHEKEYGQGLGTFSFISRTVCRLYGCCAVRKPPPIACMALI